MPCGVTESEKEYYEQVEIMSNVLSFLEELEGKEIVKTEFGYRPDAYEKVKDIQKYVAELCDKLKHVDATKYSLDLQIWWLNHQKEDQLREKND